MALVLGLAGCISSGGEPDSANAARLALERGPQSGRQLFESNCGACHGADGKGRPVTQVGFDQPLPDFTDCSFNSPEQSADWVAIAHEGGPIRGFSPIMPAFGDALTTAELEKLVAYVRELCVDPHWPRGELNFPKALFTEKAFPENETLVRTVRDRDGSTETKIFYEKRIGARSQYEIVVPYATVDTGSPDHWQQGFGDFAVAFKQVLAHDSTRGYIVSAAAELSLPTGSERDGLGAGHPTLETFVAAGKQLPADFFLQSRATYVAPLDGSIREAELQVAVGRMMTSHGPYGRQWNPMIEVLGARALESGAKTEWDWVPQVQISINQRQHLLFNVGVRLPLTDRDSRDPQIAAYFLWDWFDGGLREGW
jgi:mono/diheme cytochrome c family protein